MSHTTGGYAGGFAFILVVFILLVIIGAAVVRPGGYGGYGY
ncbi:YjcZ family sporulation protein [Evansella sp. AB-P1]|nr:YjcZ family sporulation protein [Evansella sp. AB-P1]MDG5786824.1 YjcZ family sporulation protein [Evansella sp. AB-P1]